MNRFLKYIIGLIALPAVWAFSKVFYFQLCAIGFLGTKINFFLWGIISYMLVHILFWKPNYLYTLGHESIHVLATWICGGHISSFHVSDGGGSVTTSKSNFFIELSPYFVPIYTMILICIMPLVKSTLTELNLFSGYIFVIGFSMGMHLIMTADALKVKQPDILRSGYLFSYAIIYIGNLIVIAAIFSIFSSDLSIKTYLAKSFSSSWQLYFNMFREFFV